MRIRLSAMLILVGLASSTGCNRGAAVQGTVTIDGQLAHGGTVVFHPVAKGPTAYSSIDANGSYALRVGQGNRNNPNASGIPLGDYVVTVVINMPSTKDTTAGDAAPPVPGARMTAAKYADTSTTDLKATVKAGTNIVPLDLKGASGEEAATVSVPSAGTPSSAAPAGAQPAPKSEPSAEKAASPKKEPSPKSESATEKSEEKK